jgi:hypothetical protein
MCRYEVARDLEGGEAGEAEAGHDDLILLQFW